MPQMFKHAFSGTSYRQAVNYRLEVTPSVISWDVPPRTVTESCQGISGHFLKCFRIEILSLSSGSRLKIIIFFPSPSFSSLFSLFFFILFFFYFVTVAKAMNKHGKASTVNIFHGPVLVIKKKKKKQSSKKGSIQHGDAWKLTVCFELKFAVWELFFLLLFYLIFFFLELGVLQDKLKRCRHSPRSCLEKLTVWYLFKKKKIKCIWDITGTFR